MGNALQDGPHELGDPVQRGGLMIGKGDSERYEHADGTYYDYAQGDASFEGAEFTIYNESESPVLVDVDGNGSFEDDESFAPQSAIQTIATSYDAELDAWVARTPKEHLPFGSYRVKETKAPEGHLNAGTIEKAFEIGRGGDYIQLVRDEGALNEVVTGGVMLQKHDLELGRSEALGGHAHSTLGAAGHRGTSLAGIEFDLVNESSHGVMVNGSYFGTGQKVMTLTTAWNPEKGAYTAQTGAHTLPYGTYSLKETKTNESYLLSDGKARTFQIREHGKVVETDVEGTALTWKDQVVRLSLIHI